MKEAFERRGLLAGSQASVTIADCCMGRVSRARRAPVVLKPLDDVACVRVRHCGADRDSVGPRLRRGVNS
jgi:hypothetical protein